MKRSVLSRNAVAGGVASLMILAIGLLALPASGQTIEVPIDFVAVGGDEGSVAVLGQTDVSADLVGRTCDLVATVKNQSSVYPGNTLIVSSGGNSIEVADIEATADGVTTQAGTLTLGSTIQVSVRFGPAGYTSLGSDLTVTCKPLAPTPPAPVVTTTPPYTG